MNHVTLIGNLGADPVLRRTQSNTAVANLRVATNETFRVGDETRTRTTWHRVVVWGRQAEACAQHLEKGRQVAVTGSIRSNRWTDNDGNQRVTQEIHARSVEFLGGPRRPQASNDDTSDNDNSEELNEDFDDDEVPY